MQHRWTIEGLVELASLFQDVLWFGLAFTAFCIWSCFRVVEENAGDLAKKKSVPSDTVAEKYPKQAPPCADIGSTPIQVDAIVQAMYSDNKDGLRELLDARSRWNSKSINACDGICCCTALHMAAHCNCIAVAEALLDKRADVNVCDAWDETPLHFAARAGNVEVCKLLLENHASVNASNADGNTPLLVAAQARKTTICELLLDRGAHTGGVCEDEVPSLLSNILMSRISSNSN